MGVDWRSLGWVEYQMLLAGWNAAHDTGEPKKGEAYVGRLQRFMAAHQSVQ